jgi:hypothetical protein
MNHHIHFTTQLAEVDYRQAPHTSYSGFHTLVETSRTQKLFQFKQKTTEK